MAWGDNSGGQLVNGDTTNSDVPVLVGGLSGVKSIAAGFLHSVARQYREGAAALAQSWGASIDPVPEYRLDRLV